MYKFIGFVKRNPLHLHLYFPNMKLQRRNTLTVKYTSGHYINTIANVDITYTSRTHKRDLIQISV